MIESDGKMDLDPGVDSIAVSVFADIFIEMTNAVSDNKIQITILILWRGSCLATKERIKSTRDPELHKSVGAWVGGWSMDIEIH